MQFKREVRAIPNFALGVFGSVHRPKVSHPPLLSTNTSRFRPNKASSIEISIIMKKTILLLTLLFYLLPAVAAGKFDIHPTKKIDANPINVAVMLTEQLDSANVIATCEYYGYVNQPSQDGFTVFRHPNGSVIRFKYTTADNGKKYPTVDVKSKGTQKENDKILESLNFRKNGNVIERKSIGFTTQCMSVPHGFLRLKPQPKDRTEKR